MIKFSCEKALLSSAISTVSRTVAQKSTIAALEGICLDVGSYVCLSGYNMETGITVTLYADIREQGSCIMPAHLFSEIIRKLPDDLVTISVDSSYKVSITCGISAFTISALSSEDYPELPDVEANNAVQLPQRDLRSMINGTLFSVSDNQARPVQTGCLIEVEDSTITMVAVDGYRLALRRVFLEEEFFPLHFVVPGSGLKEVERLLSDSDDPVKFTLGPRHILFETANTTLVCRLLEGDFLDWKRVIPRNNPISLAVNVREMTSCIERVNLIIDEKVKSPVHCYFSNNRADFRVSNTIGRVSDMCHTAGDGNELEIGFNCRYLLEALRAVPTEEVILEMKNSLSPAILIPCTDPEKFLYMVLPVRLKANEN